MIKTTLRCATLGVVMGAMSMAAQANMITNGDFESGTFDGWTVSANATGVASYYDGFTAESGSYFVYLCDTSGQAPYGTISQALTTTAGQTYSLSYWLASDGQTPNHFDASWNGSIIGGSAVSDISPMGYTQYLFTVTGTGSDTLTFHEQNEPGYLALDNVSLSASTAPVPEPASLGLLGLGMVGLALRRKSRQ